MPRNLFRNSWGEALREITGSERNRGSHAILGLPSHEVLLSPFAHGCAEASFEERLQIGKVVVSAGLGYEFYGTVCRGEQFLDGV